MLRIIQNVRLFAPEDQGICHLVICGNRIHSVSDTLPAIPSDMADVINGHGMWLAPGFIDGLVHSVGGGGEGGFINRTPEIHADDMLKNGVTTAVSALGTDAITRNLPNLLGKCRELSAKGIDSYFYTGSYHLPPTTLTGSVATDLLYIPEIIGIGELALSDLRGSVIRFDDLYAIARQVRTSANLAGKKGVVFCHIGDHPDQLTLLDDLIEKTELPYSLFIPTHINRNPALFTAGIRYARAGGFIDITTSTNQGLLDDGEVFCSEALAKALQAGVPVERISFSSDANASLPRFDADGNTIGVDTGRIASLYEAVQLAVTRYGVPFDLAIQCITSTPANALGFHRKGYIRPGFDADLVLIQPDNMQIKQVWSQGVPRI
ncbi:MAG: beta-aspartyl-peptidase [Photobacterium halotolerans]